jgi:hypothetical protein
MLQRSTAFDFTARGLAARSRKRTLGLTTLSPGLQIGFAGDSIVAGAGHGIAGERFAYRSQKYRLTANRAASGQRTDQIAAQLPLVIADGAMGPRATALCRSRVRRHLVADARLAHHRPHVLRAAPPQRILTAAPETLPRVER